MSAKAIKLLRNYAPAAGLRALGPALYGRYLASGVRSIPSIMRDRNLTSVDRQMSLHARRFFRFGRPFVYDCDYADRTLNSYSANNFAFGIARELYVRDCYLRFLPPEVVQAARTVVDIGANRGAFASMMTTVASKIVAVEADAPHEQVIRHNLMSSGFTNFTIEVGFVGDGGELAPGEIPRIAIDELFARNNLTAVDLLKMDIEGSEFALFRNPEWLEVVKALTMEIHPRHGDPAIVLAELEGRGYETRIANENVQLVTRPAAANFLYAWRR